MFLRTTLVAVLLVPLISTATTIDVGQVEVTPDDRLLIGIDSYGERTVDGSIDGPYTSVEIASEPDSNGKLTLANSAELVAGTLIVGGAGTPFLSPRTATVRIEGGSSLFTSEARVGDGAQGLFGVEVNGVGSTWINDGGILMRPTWSGGGSYLEVTGGGYLSTNVINGEWTSSSTSIPRRILVDGAGSRLVTRGLTFGVFNTGPAELMVSNGGLLSSGATTFGSYDPQQGIATVTGPGSTWITDELWLGLGGRVRVLDGGRLQSARIGGVSDTTTSVLVSGSGSRWDLEKELIVSNGWMDQAAGGGVEVVQVSDGGTIESTGGKITGYNESVTSLYVSGPGSSWINRGDLQVDPIDIPGRNWTFMSVSGGGLVENMTARLVRGAVKVSGDGSLWNNRGEVLVGDETGASEFPMSVQILDGARMRAPSVTVWEDGSVDLTNGILDAPSVEISGGKLRGGGTVTGNVQNDGTVAVEGPLGIGGQFTQGPTGTLQIGIRSLTDFDVLSVGATAFLDGLLSIEWLSGVVPDFGDRFEILTWSDRVGSFDLITGLQIDPTHFLQAVYEADGLFLEAKPDILVLDEQCSGSQAHLPTALSNLGLSFTHTQGTAEFEAALGNGTTWDLVVVDEASSSLSASGISSLEQYAALGGRLLLSYHSLDPVLAANLDAVLGASYPTPLSVRRWSGACCGPRHPVYLDRHVVGSLAPGANTCGSGGFFLDPATDGLALAGYTARPDDGQSAVIVGNEGRSLLLGFVPGLFPAEQMVPFLENAVSFLLEGYPVYSVAREDGLLRRIDPASGDTISSTPLSLPGKTITGASGLTRDPATGELWGLLDIDGQGGRELARIDPYTGVSTPAGNTALDLADITADCTSSLHSVSSDAATPESEALYRLDAHTGAPSLLANLGNGNDGEALAFRPEDGRLYHLSGSTEQVFERIDPVSFATVGISLSGDAYQEATALAPVAQGTSHLLFGDAGSRLFGINTDGIVNLVGSTDHVIEGLAASSVRCCSDPSDADCDGIANAADLCPFYPGSAADVDTDGNGIGDECECGDQNTDGRVTVSDIVGINQAIFTPSLVTPLCDTDGDDLCNVSDIVGANNKIFGAPAYCSRYPPPGP